MTCLKVLTLLTTLYLQLHLKFMFRQSIFKIYDNLPNKQITETQVWKIFYYMGTITSDVFLTSIQTYFQLLKNQQFLIMLTVICSFNSNICRNANRKLNALFRAPARMSSNKCSLLINYLIKSYFNFFYFFRCSAVEK